MYTVTKRDIIDICKHMVMTYPFSQCTRINTFAVVDNAADMNTPNLGATYADYLDGLFWSRKWQLAGAPKGEMCKQYPLLVLEQKTKVKANIFDSESCMDFYFVLADVEDCLTCSDQCKRTSNQVMCDLSDMVEVITGQLKKYKLFLLTKADESTSYAWVTQGQVDYWVTNNEILSGRPLTDLRQFIEGKNINIYPTNLGTSDGALGVAFHFKVCSCVDVNREFDYSTPKAKTTAVTQCKTC